MFYFLKNLKSSWVIKQKIKNNWNDYFLRLEFFQMQAIIYQITICIT